MADKTTIARPYAKAAFAEARADSMLDAWSAALHTAAAVVDDPRVHSLLGDPHVSREQLSQLVLDIAGSGLGEHGRNFVQMLAEAGRLICLPEIAALFDGFKDDAEGIADVRSNQPRVHHGQNSRGVELDCLAQSRIRTADTSGDSLGEVSSRLREGRRWRE